MSGILVDENLPSTLLLGEDIRHVTDWGERRTDTSIWELARREEWVLVTRDTDFYHRLALHGPPPKVVWLRLGNLRRRELEQQVNRLWPDILRLLEECSLVMVQEGRLEGLAIGPD